MKKLLIVGLVFFPFQVFAMQQECVEQPFGDIALTEFHDFNTPEVVFEIPHPGFVPKLLTANGEIRTATLKQDRHTLVNILAMAGLSSVALSFIDIPPNSNRIPFVPFTLVRGLTLPLADFYQLLLGSNLPITVSIRRLQFCLFG